MRRSIAPALLYSLLLFAGAFVLSVATSPDLRVAPARASATLQPEAVPELVGSWEGSWTDTRYNVSGPMNMEITLDGDTYNAVGTIDVTEASGGILRELIGTATGTLSGNSMAFTFECTDLGSGEGSFTDGLASGTGVVTAPLNFGAFEFSGDVIGGEMTGTFDFTDPNGGNGTASLSRSVPVEDTSWSELKSDYRD